MDIEAMETFLSVVRNSSISKAAAELYATQPTISLRVKRLESELGFEILTRSWRGVELTPQGRLIVPVIADHIIRMKSAVDLAKNDSAESGAPSIVDAHAAPTTVAIDEWLVGTGIAELVSKISGLEGVHLTVTSSARLHAMVAHGICNRGISYPSPGPHESASIATELWCEQLAVVFPDTDPPPIPITRPALKSYFATRRFLLMDDPIFSDHAKITGPLLQAVDPFETRVVDHTAIMASLCTQPGFATIIPAGLCYRKQEFTQPGLTWVTLAPGWGTLPVVLLKADVAGLAVEKDVDVAISSWAAGQTTS